MANKKKQVTGEEPVTSDQVQVTREPLVVGYSDLMASRVQVAGDGAMFYLDPGRHAGEFVLRAVPQAPAEVEAELPDEWRKPTLEETKAAEKKIDWKIPGSEEEAPANEEETVEEVPANEVPIEEEQA